MKMMIWFDMDGTIADLYAVEGWLEALRAEQTTPYELAEPMLRMSTLARQLNAVQRHGYGIGIISWCSKVSTEEYDRRIAEAKMAWLAKHLPSGTWDEIHIVPYGTPKYEVCGSGFLFDDEHKNRIDWDKYAGIAFGPEHITEVLSTLNRG
mgnify:CR=1 FL=1